MVCLAGLALRDVGMRLGERLVDAVRPLHSRRERLEITQHVIMTKHGPIDLSSIQSLRLSQTSLGTKLVAHTVQGEVEVTQHRSQQVMEGIRLVLLDEAERRRGQLVAQGIEPDDPERIPATLAKLRATHGVSGH